MFFFLLFLYKLIFLFLLFFKYAVFFKISFKYVILPIKINIPKDIISIKIIFINSNILLKSFFSNIFIEGLTTKKYLFDILPIVK